MANEATFPLGKSYIISNMVGEAVEIDQKLFNSNASGHLGTANNHVIVKWGNFRRENRSLLLENYVRVN